MDLFQWLTDTTEGKCLFTMLVSMIPIIELRGGHALRGGPGPALLAGLSRRGDRATLSPPPSLSSTSAGSSRWMRRYMPRLNGMVDKLEKKAHLKGQKVQQLPVSGPVALCGHPPARHRSMDRLSGGRLSGHAAEAGPARCGAGGADRRVHHDCSDPRGDQSVLR